MSQYHRKMKRRPGQSKFIEFIVTSVTIFGFSFLILSGIFLIVDSFTWNFLIHHSPGQLLGTLLLSLLYLPLITLSTLIVMAISLYTIASVYAIRILELSHLPDLAMCHYTGSLA